MTTPARYSKRVYQFLQELDSLCRRYDLRLETSGYDLILIYGGAPDDGVGIVYTDFGDCTGDLLKETGSMSTDDTRATAQADAIVFPTPSTSWGHVVSALVVDTPSACDPLKDEMLDVAEIIFSGGDGEAEALGADLARAVLTYFRVIDKDATRGPLPDTEEKV